MPRALPDWITGYLDYTENSESPLSYNLWGAVSIIASVLERKCFMEWGATTIYPNHYIVLVGPSALARKAEPIKVARDFLDYIGIPIASQSLTREALINTIVNGSTTYLNSQGSFVIQSPMTVLSPELSVLLGQRDLKFLSDLTDWYDSHDYWSYQTLKRSKETITGVCVNILAATAPDWLPSILPQESVGGGWTSRVIWVSEDKKRKIVANPTLTPPDKDLCRKLETDLEQIHMLEGEFVFEASALELYVNWYTLQEEGLAKGIWPVADPKFHAYVGRRATHVKKLAICLAASRSDNLVLYEDDLKRAIVMLEAAEKKMPRAFSGVGRSPISDMTDAVLDYIKNQGACRRSRMLNAFYRDLDGWTLEKIEKVLEAMKVIQIRVIPAEGDVEYKYIGGKSGVQNLDTSLPTVKD